jgi:hypothetical protein
MNAMKCDFTQKASCSKVARGLEAEDEVNAFEQILVIARRWRLIDVGRLSWVSFDWHKVDRIKQKVISQRRQRQQELGHNSTIKTPEVYMRSKVVDK